MCELKKLSTKKATKNPIKLMFMDEAGFGRISKPYNCWCAPGVRPCIPCHHIREYRYAFGAVEPLTGDSQFLVMPNCDTDCMNVFLEFLSKQYPDEQILLCCDGAAWHKSKRLQVPDNVKLLFIPPYTPEMNPIEQIWREIRTQGFKNRIFHSLEAVVEQLCNTIRELSRSTIKSITGRQWILDCFA